MAQYKANMDVLDLPPDPEAPDEPYCYPVPVALTGQEAGTSETKEHCQVRLGGMWGGRLGPGPVHGMRRGGGRLEGGFRWRLTGQEGELAEAKQRCQVKTGKLGASGRRGGRARASAGSAGGRGRLEGG